MQGQEAELLPLMESNLRPGGTRPQAQIHGGPMSEAIPKVLMLRCVAVSQQDVRTAARHAGLSLNIAFAENRREFQEELRHGSISLIVAGPEAAPDFELHDLLERARSVQPPVPVILIGGQSSETESLRSLREGATEYLPNSELDHLPSVLARALRVRESNSVHVRTQVELDRAAGLLRDNQKLITIGRLAASIAHEINNPLEAVTNLLYLVGEEKGLPESARSYLELAQRELDRVGQISRQTLNFSRETRGPVRTRIDGLMEEVLSLYSRRIAEKNLRVERQYDCPDEAIVYPGEMRQVLSNLITNAVEASEIRGRLRVRIRCARNWSDPGVKGIRISVGDNGTGIEPAVQRRLGEPFYTTKGQRGTGLGLWVTRSIIQRYGGEIQLRSSIAPNRHGTVFSIFLPTNMRPTMVERTPDPDRSGSGSQTRKTQPFRISGGSGSAVSAGDRSRENFSEFPEPRRASGD